MRIKKTDQSIGVTAKVVHEKSTTADNVYGVDYINQIVEGLGLDQDTYDSTKTYAVGKLVIHNYQIWECTTAITKAEEWNPAHWTLVPVFV